jgi:quercetin dioxygenase-like cupin family protein
VVNVCIQVVFPDGTERCYDGKTHEEPLHRTTVLRRHFGIYGLGQDAIPSGVGERGWYSSMNQLVRDKIMELERTMRVMPQVEIPVRHYFAQGVYAREICIPKGAIITGMIHRQSQINLCLKGDISIVTEEGERRFKSGETIVSPPGTKRAAYAHEETVWTTVLGTELTDVQEIEATLVCQSFEELCHSSLQLS